MWKNGKTERFGKSKNEQFLWASKAVEKSDHSNFLKSAKLAESTQSIFYSNQNIRKIQKCENWKN